MARPRKNPLPSGVYERKHASGRRTLWIWFRDAEGRRVHESAGASIAEAVALLSRRKREVREGEFSRGSEPATISEYFEQWAPLRAAEGVRSHQREAQTMRSHILPALGSVRLDELRPRDVAAWVRRMRADAKLSPKSIRNAHGVLSAMLSRARFDERISDNPARGLPEGILPANVKTKQTGAWTRSECETLMSDERIPEDRRVLYAIAAFTGARLGEICGLRWEDIDTDAAPLGRWALRSQWNREPLKTDQPRDIPIHGVLARILAEWRLNGWPRFVRRVPSSSDLVLPRASGTLHSRNSAGAKAVRRHADMVGMAAGTRDFHSFRRAFVTLARTDGAPVEIVERITHNSRGEQIDGYTYFGWESLCDAVSRVRLERHEGRVLQLDPALRGYANCYAGGIGGGIAAISQLVFVEAPGIEPGSENPRPRPLRA